MVELKLTAENLDGNIIGSIISADSVALAREKAELIAAQNNLKIRNIEKKQTFIYSVRREKGKPILGEKTAFNKEDVIQNLTSLGYEVMYVRKKLFDMNKKPSESDILNFVKMSADMLEQKLSFGEIMNFLINDARNKIFKETLKTINRDLKMGVDSEQAFLKHEDVLGRFTAYMLGLASKSGNMAEMYRATVKFLERKYEFKKKLRSALISPLVTILVLLAACVWYVAYIFPETAKLFLRFKVDLPPMTAFTLDMSYFLADHIFLITFLLIAPIFAVWGMYKHPKGRIIFDKWLFKLPLIGELIHRTIIEIFCRVFYTLYSGSAVSILPIKIAAEASDNRYFEKQIKEITIPYMMNKGAGITDGLIASGVFTETAISKLSAGEETGNLKSANKQLADYYESDTVYRLNNLIEWVQIAISMFILVVMVLLTLVSAETAIIRPNRDIKAMILIFISTGRNFGKFIFRQKQ